MKIKSGYMLRVVAEHYVVIPIGARTVDFTGIITLNNTGAFLWESLSGGITEDELEKKLRAEYGIDADTAKGDIRDFVKVLEDNDLLER